ncbi:MAG: rhomboid family intramembrane serine protease [Actinobacteria bacterium]|nr:rhomboid family intramembrane serine protease [Actinomycetota bacterium]NBY15930.1 rhomboid family intramembrane serine protease [Actinomycetota bacterium]
MVNAPVGFQCPDCAAISNPRGTRTASVQRSGPLAAMPAVSRNIFVACIAIFLAGKIFGSANDWVWRFGMWPDGVAQGQWSRLLAATFLHSGILHIAFNMYALYVLGPNLENLLGSRKFFALYFLSALGGSTAGLWFSDPASTSIGASGAIFGLLTATIIIGRHLRADVSQLVVLLLINVALGFSGGIDWRAHLGGAATGALIASIYVRDPALNKSTPHRLGTAAVAIGLIVLIFLRCQQLVS